MGERGLIVLCSLAAAVAGSGGWCENRLLPPLTLPEVRPRSAQPVLRNDDPTVRLTQVWLSHCLFCPARPDQEERLPGGGALDHHPGRLHPRPPQDPPRQGGRPRPQETRHPRAARPPLLLSGLGGVGPQQGPRIHPRWRRLRRLAGELQGKHIQQEPHRPRPRAHPQ